MGRGAGEALLEAAAPRAGKLRGAYDPQEVYLRLRALLPDADDLRKPEYRGNPNPFVGHCYITTEAFCYLTGATQKTVKHGPGSFAHWFAELDGEIWDLTAEQFDDQVPYENGRGCGFQGKPGVPSERARKLMARAGFPTTGLPGPRAAEARRQ